MPPASCLSFILAIFGDVSAAEAEVIYQAFNTPFRQVQSQLPRIKKLGYTYVQISPPQSSHPSAAWWARYQPIDFTAIASPLGNESELRELITQAHTQKLKILVDVVLNHMANYGYLNQTLQYPKFSPNDFHPRICIHNYQDRSQVLLGWTGRTCDLPDLKTESPYVRQQAKNYLIKLLSLGVDGFRFDAAKHIDPEFFKEVLQVVPLNKYSYGEVIGETFEESFEYTRFFAVTDFHLLRTMINAFKWGGDLRSLVNPADTKRALPGRMAVTFARNHDTVEDRSFFNFPTQQDAMLANAYILAIQEGLPFVFGADAENPIVKAGVQFHEKMVGKSQFFRSGREIATESDRSTLLFIERGSQGLAIINKADSFFDIPRAKMVGLEVGCYREEQFNFTISVGRGGDGQKYITRWGNSERGGIQIGPRTALFLTLTSPQSCQ